MEHVKVKEEYLVASLRQQVLHLEGLLQELQAVPMPREVGKRISEIEEKIRRLRNQLAH